MKTENGLDAIVRGYLVRALRKIDDVAVTDTDPDFKIDCIAVPCAGIYALSFVVSTNEDFVSMLTGYEIEGKPLPEEVYTYLLDKYEAAGRILATGSRSQLEQACSEFVAAFEGDQLQLRNIIKFHRLQLDKHKQQKEAR